MPSLTPRHPGSDSPVTGATASDRWLKLLLDSTHTFPWESDLSRDTLTFVGERSVGRDRLFTRALLGKRLLGIADL